MADIELVIKIPEGLKKDFEWEQWTALSCMAMKNALINSIPLDEMLDKNRCESDCRECKAEHDCYECEKYAESEEKDGNNNL